MEVTCTSDRCDYHDTNMNIDYTQHTVASDHEYSSLHDMIDVDMASNMEASYPQMDIACGKPDIAKTEMFSPTSSCGQMPPTSNTSCSTNIDLDSSVSNLSWLHSLQQQIPESNGNPNLMVNPQTVTPVVSHSAPVRVLTLPNNVHISNAGNIKYVTVPHSKQQLYVSTTKSSMIQSTLNHRSYSHSPGSAPSSTVPDNPFPKPAYSYSCLIALALKNSRRGSLPVAEIYNFMMTNFPYFKTAPDGWKNSVRHNLSLNKCFEKIENPNSDGTHSRKGCLWAMNPTKVKKMDEEVIKWNKKDLIAIKRSMANPDLLDTLTKGHGAYLMEKTTSVRGHNYQNITHLQHRPGVRIVTAVQPQQHHHITIGQGHILDRQHLHETIDLQKLAEDAADLFGDHDDLALDPSLSELALQNGILEELPGDILDNSFTHSPSTYLSASALTSPLTSPAKSQMYNPHSIVPIY